MNTGARTLMILVAISLLGLIALALMARSVTEVQHQDTLEFAAYLRRTHEFEIAAFRYLENNTRLEISLSKTFDELPDRKAWEERIEQISRITRINFRSPKTSSVRTVTFHGTAVTRSGCATQKLRVDRTDPWPEYKSEDGGGKTEDGKPKAEDGGQKSEDGG